MIRFVLASASPARLGLLRASGVHPEVQVSTVDETVIRREWTQLRATRGLSAPTPAEIALHLAKEKARDVALHWADALILGCDSILELDGRSYGKPTNAEQARTRWRMMRGRTGTLHTGHWLVDTRGVSPYRPEPDGQGANSQHDLAEVGRTASTQVQFGYLDNAEIDSYVATGEPLQVAGAFTLDGFGAPYVEAVTGSPSAVIGLSLPLLRDLLGQRGVPWHLLRLAPTSSAPNRPVVPVQS